MLSGHATGLSAHRGALSTLRCVASASLRRRRYLTSQRHAVSWVTDQHEAGITPLDAIVVLGGGLTSDGGLPEWVTRRLDAACDLHHLNPRRPPILCLGAGTPHKPPVLSPTKYVIHEATSCAKYLLAKGIPAPHILKETCSYDTVGNAYFSLTTHAVPAAWRRLAVVTSAFHMPRTRALFDDLYGLAGRSLFGDPDWFLLSYFPVSDEGVFAPHVLQARIDKEAQSRLNWQLERHQHQVHSLAELHAWLHSTHLCYSVARQHEFGQPTELSAELAASY